MSDDVLSIEGLSYSYKDQEVLNNIYLDLKLGERTAVLGESGSGKTTLAQAVAEYKKIDIGELPLITYQNAERLFFKLQQ